MEQPMDKQQIKQNARKVLDPIVHQLAVWKVPPTAVSILGLIISLYGAYVLAKGSLFWGGFWLLASGLADVVDGSLARYSHTDSKFGAFLDSTLDRVTELAYFGAIILYYVGRPQGFSDFTLVLVLVAMSGSILISYARARLEGLGYTCKVGLLERTERIALLTVGLILGSRVLWLVLLILAVGTTLTVIQRLVHAHRVTREPRLEPQPDPEPQPAPRPDRDLPPTAPPAA